ncbi:MAG: hypothetical protein QXR02_07440 [Acidilobaceae archaeon]
MGFIEADLAVVYGRIVENFRVPFSEDLYFKTVVVPGFSDGHAHPQVVDGGVRPGLRWSDSYDWIRSRDLVVDEVMIRRDVALASRLSKLTLYRSLLEGTTLIALTGRLLANVKALLSIRVKPRVVLLPTVMDRVGWTLSEVKEDYERVRLLVSDGFARMGVFIHSLGLASRSTIVDAIKVAVESGGILGLHLGEGVSEIGEFKSIFGNPPYSIRIIPVHCIDDDVSSIGLNCVACPSTNIILYGRTKSTLIGVSSFGSDWPLILGTIPRHLPLITRLYRGQLELILKNITIGGYRTYNVSHEGDIVAYDEKLDQVIDGRSKPKLVTINWEIAVYEGALKETSYNIGDVEKQITEAVKESIELYGHGEPPDYNIYLEVLNKNHKLLE